MEIVKMNSNSMAKIQAINNLSVPQEILVNQNKLKNKDYYHTFNTSLGGYWCSYRTIPKDIIYQAELPVGIHIGAGIASISMQAKSFGHYNFSGTLASYFIQPKAEQEIVKTTLKKGQAISCGLFIPWEQEHDTPIEIAVFLEKISNKLGFHGSQQISPLLIEKLCSPIDSWYQGDAIKLISEARAYELLAAVMAAFTMPKNLTKTKTKHVLSARDIIEANLMKSISLQALAKETGTNVRSLTQEFRQYFGLSVNQYLSERRMEKSLKLLEQGLSVSQTAYQVGYSLPYFSEKFQQRFGISASQVPHLNSLPNS